MKKTRAVTPTERSVAIEIRAAELADLYNRDRARRVTGSSTTTGALLGELVVAIRGCKRATPDEFEWLVHGDSPAHTFNHDEPDGRYIPTNDEQWAGLLAHEINQHDEGLG